MMQFIACKQQSLHGFQLELKQISEISGYLFEIHYPDTGFGIYIYIYIYIYI